MKRTIANSPESIAGIPTYKLQLPIRKSVSPRKKIKRLLRAMLSIGVEHRETEEERNLLK